MKYNATAHRAKNGTNITIRQATRSDAQQLLDNGNRIFREETYLLTTAEEFDLTLEQEQVWIQNFIDQPNALLLVAETPDGNIVGNIDTTPAKLKRLQHTAIIGMSVIGGWQGQGIGGFLMRETIGWARQYSTLELLWLKVLGGNDAAIALYQKCGFVQDGVQPAFVKVNENLYFDNIFMRLVL